MKILIVTAHPSSKGFSHQVAARYAVGARASGHEVEILDLYKTEIKQDFVRFEDIKDWSYGAESRAAMQAKIAWADQLVFAHPLWWGGMPAILKNWIDNNFVPGFAYKNIKRPFIPRQLNVLPLGLLAPRTARVFVTCDGMNWLYALMGWPFFIIWRFIILMYCGVRVQSLVLFDQMRWRSDEHKARWLDRVERMGRKA